MATPLLELRGTWEEIAAQLPDFHGRRLHVIVEADESNNQGEATPLSPLDAALEDIWATVPDEVWDQFPADFADNMDHYLSGTPKRP
jgi:hypothetical protein